MKVKFQNVPLPYNVRMRTSRLLKRIALLAAGLVVACAGWIGASLFFLPPVAPLANSRASLVITVKD
ncbi:MAG: hypothetical protein AABY80_02160, partial [Candidatus Deferrimicrobiota bacterium]